MATVAEQDLHQLGVRFSLAQGFCVRVYATQASMPSDSMLGQQPNPLERISSANMMPLGAGSITPWWMAGRSGSISS
jgi:hypothetical protein